MALTQITGPYPIFTDLDGSPLDDGYLYIGEINEDPETNPIQVYWDSNLTIPATQPIRTNSGYAYRNGTPALIYTGSQFSITIRNKKREFVLYSPVGYGFDPAAVSASVVKNDFTGDGVEVAFTLSASPSTKLATNVFINGVYQEKDSYSLSGNVITFSVAPPLSSSIEVMTNETGVINTGNATAITYTASFPGAVQQTVQTKLEQYVSVKDFGAVGDGVTDDTTAIQAALASSPSVYFPSGSYNISATESSPITLALNDASIFGGSATIINTANKSFGTFKITGVGVTVDGIVFDGNNTSLNCLMVADTASNVTIKNCEFKNFSQQTGDTTFAVGVVVQNGSDTVLIENCYIHDIQSPITGIARGVLGTGYGTAATYFTNLTVQNCRFENIGPAADGDGVVLQPDLATSNINSSVINCHFKNVEKRGVKIQGSGCQVLGGSYDIPAAGTYSAISVYGDDCKVVGFSVAGAGDAYVGIEVGAVSATVGSRTVVQGCSIKNATTGSSNDGIRCFGTISDIVISGNIIDTVRNGINISAAGARASVTGNTVKNCAQNGIANTGESGVYMSNVVIAGNTVTNVGAYSFRNDGGTNFTAVANTDDNSGFGSGPNNSLRETFLLNSSNGVQTTNNAAPTAGTWSRGDIVWNIGAQNSYGNVGWVCITSGTPGTWRPIGQYCERGSTGSRPTKTSMGVANDGDFQGTMYFDNTLAGNGKPIWWNGSAWVDATGTVV